MHPYRQPGPVDNPIRVKVNRIERDETPFPYLLWAAYFVGGLMYWSYLILR